jgi:hypothetical protein
VPGRASLENEERLRLLAFQGTARCVTDAQSRDSAKAKPPRSQRLAVGLLLLRQRFHHAPESCWRPVGSPATAAPWAILASSTRRKTRGSPSPVPLMLLVSASGWQIHGLIIRARDCSCWHFPACILFPTRILISGPAPRPVALFLSLSLLHPRPPHSLRPFQPSSRPAYILRQSLVGPALRLRLQCTSQES